MNTRQDGLRDAHREALLGAFEEIERLCREIETAMASQHEALPNHRDDLTPRQIEVLEAGLKSLRAQLQEAMDALQIDPPQEPPSARRIVRSALLFAELTLHEVDTKRITGYGELPADAAARIGSVEHQLIDLLRRIRIDFDRG